MNDAMRHRWWIVAAIAASVFFWSGDCIDCGSTAPYPALLRFSPPPTRRSPSKPRSSIVDSHSTYFFTNATNISLISIDVVDIEVPSPLDPFAAAQGRWVPSEQERAVILSWVSSPSYSIQFAVYFLAAKPNSTFVSLKNFTADLVNGSASLKDLALADVGEYYVVCSVAMGTSGARNVTLPMGPLRSGRIIVNHTVTLASELRFSQTNVAIRDGNQSSCAAVNVPLADIKIELWSSNGIRFVPPRPAEYAVGAEALDTKSGYELRYSLVNSTASFDSDGFATFKGLTISQVMPMSVLHFFAIVNGTRIVTGPELYLFAVADRVARAACSLVVSQHRGILDLQEYNRSFVIQQGVSFPTFYVSVLDSAGHPDASTTGIMLSVSASAGKLNHSDYPVIDGIATISGFALYDVPSAMLNKPVVVLQFSLSRNLSLPMYTEPITVTSSPAAASAVVFDPRNSIFAFEAESGSLHADLLTLPQIRVDVLRADRSIDTSAFFVEVAASCDETQLDPTSTTKVKVSAGVVSFTNLRFATRRTAFPTNARLTFTAIAPDEIIDGRIIKTGPIKFLPSTSTRSVRMRFARRNSLFSGEFQRAYAVTEEPLPLITIEVLNADGTVDRLNNELSITVKSSSGTFINQKAFCFRGEVQFSKLIFVRSRLGASRISFEAGAEGNTPVAHHVLFTDVISVVDRTGSASAAAYMTFDNLNNYLLDDPSVVANNAAVPQVGISIMSSLGSVSSAADGATITASSASLDASSINTATVSNGVATFSGLKISAGSAGSGTISFCAPRSALLGSCITRAFVVAAQYPYTFQLVLPGVTDRLVATDNFTASVTLWRGTATASPTSDVQLNLSSSALLSPAIPHGVVSSGASDVPNISFADPSFVMSDMQAAFTVRAVVGGQIATGHSTPILVEPLRPLPQHYPVIVVNVNSPVKDFDVNGWLKLLADHLKIEPERIIVSLIARGKHTGVVWRGTRVELQFGPANTQSATKPDPAQLTLQLLDIQPTCSVAHLQFRSSNLLSSEKYCDTEVFASRVESSLHCEAFEGRDQRCSCFIPLMVKMGSPCISTEAMTEVCSYLSRCVDPRIKSICAEVRRSLVLQVLAVVGITIGAVAIIGIVLYFRRHKHPLEHKPKLSTSSHVLYAKRAPHDEVFI